MPDRSAPVESRGSQFRPEIQTLRALAVTLVIVFHLFPARLPGGYVGVDVFFVISGFLITAHLVRERESRGSISLSQFYARRIRRLLPAALLVLGVSLVATLVVAPVTLWRQFLTEIAASAVYSVNWVLAASSVDYFAADQIESPARHYWSLAVEEQFYLVWPLVVIAAAGWASRSHAPIRRRLAVAFSLIGVVGLTWSIVGSIVSPAFTYFATPAHAWEFAAGGLLALAPSIPAFRLSSVVALAGYGAIVVSAFVYSASTPFPGFAALVPVAGTLAVIVSRGGTGLVAAAGAWSPIRFVGEISYSAYLWHWPLIVLVPLALTAELTTPLRLVLAAATIALAAATKRWVEDPFRTSGAWALRSRTFGAAGVATVLIAAASVAPLTIQSQSADSTREFVDEQASRGNDCFGALALLADKPCEFATTVDPRVGFDPEQYAVPESPDGCPTVEASIKMCVSGSESPEKTILFVGDSHMAHYRPAVFPLLESHDWQYRFVIRGSCPAVDPAWERSRPDSPESEPGCEDWRASVIPFIAKQDVDLVVVSNYTQKYMNTDPESNRADLARAFATTWKTWTDAGIPVLVIADNPLTAAEDVPLCVATHDDYETACSLPRSDATGRDPLVAAVRDYPNPLVTLADYTDSFCDDERCYGVVGGVIVFHDKHHISPAFARSLTPRVEESLLEALRIQ